MNLEQLEKAEKWIDREMRQLQPRVIILLDVFRQGSDEKVVRIWMK